MSETLKMDLAKDDKSFTVLSPAVTAWDANKETDTKKLVERHVKLSISVKDGKVTLKYLNVEAVLGPSDHMATNGLIYNLDKVLSGGVRTAVSYAVLVVALFSTLICI